jgi:HEAT repeat protein
MIKPPPSLHEFLSMPEPKRRAVASDALSHMSNEEVAQDILKFLESVDGQIERAHFIRSLAVYVGDIRTGERLRKDRES